MRRHRVIRTLIAAALLVLAIPIAVAAQREYGYGRYGRPYLRDSIYRLDSTSMQFMRDVNLEFNRDWMSIIGIGRDNFIRSDAREFRQAVRVLSDRFDSRDLDRTYYEARRVLDLGARLDRDMQRVNSYRLESDWAQMQRDLRTITDAYGLSMR